MIIIFTDFIQIAVNSYFGKIHAFSHFFESAFDHEYFFVIHKTYDIDFLIPAHIFYVTISVGFVNDIIYKFLCSVPVCAVVSGIPRIRLRSAITLLSRVRSMFTHRAPIAFPLLSRIRLVEDFIFFSSLPSMI